MNYELVFDHLIEWLGAIGASSRAFSFVWLGITFDAAAFFMLVLACVALVPVAVIAVIAIFGMSSKNPTEW